jgi:two-component system cell cycle response regulator DivK
MVPSPPYVLVVDDSTDGREMLTEYLQFRGFHVVEAADGEAALAHARTRRPAVILMDLQMPGITGWEATRQLKAHPDTRDIIVIAMTAHAMTPDETIARQAGCDGFIAKPYDITAVADALTKLVAGGRSALGAFNALNTSTSVNGRPTRPATT